MGGDTNGNGDTDDTRGDGDTDDSQGGGTGGSGTTGDTSNMGGTPTHGAGGREALGPPSAPDCTSRPAIESGKNYGSTTDTYDYSVFAVRLSQEVAEGTYTIRVNNDSDGEAFLYLDETLVDSFEYNPDASFAESTTQTVTFPDYFEMDLRSQTVDDLTALSSSLFDGCHNIVVSNAGVVKEGGTYGLFVIESLIVDAGAMAGRYTFYAETGNGGSVVALKDGEEFVTLAYNWTTTIGGGESFTFVFEGLAEMKVTRAMGTSNLFGLADELFDGRHELTIE